MKQISGVDLPEWFTPQKWQSEFFQVYQKKCIDASEPNFLLEACPGAGKTNAIFAIAYPKISAKSKTNPGNTPSSDKVVGDSNTSTSTSRR